MAARSVNPQLRRTLMAASILLIIVLSGSILISARVVLIPLALAALLSFMLSPLVSRLQRWKVPRVPAVIIVVGVVSIFLGGMLWLLIGQLESLATDLPSYRANITEKLASLREGQRSRTIARLQETIRAISEDLRKPQSSTRKPPGDGQPNVDTEGPVEGMMGPSDGAGPVEVMKGSSEGAEGPSEEPVSETPVPVKLVDPEESDAYVGTVAGYLTALAPALDVLATLGLTIILAVFMLIRREDLRNRLVSFAREGAISTATKALDDAAHRISRYLLMQLIINGSFGLCVFIGLYFVGVPYAFLWGLFAAVFRYIPYIGPWIAALLPIGVSLISSPGWTQVILVIGVFLVLELFSNNVMEPWLYGQGIGISEVALLVSAAFWTWTWGPIGLVMATPLTVCLLVAGKYVPQLGILERLLGDHARVKPHVVFLQRLLARDADEASEVAERFAKEHGLEVYDQLMIPALALVRSERAHGSMTPEDEVYVTETTAAIVAQLAAREKALREVEPDEPPVLAEDEAVPPADTAVVPLPPSAPLRLVFGCPAHHEIEELALQMLEQLWDQQENAMIVTSTRAVPSEVVRRIAAERPEVVVISVIAPSGLAQARYFCRQIRKHCPETGIVVGAWQYSGNLDRLIGRMRAAGANYITTTLRGAANHVNHMEGKRCHAYC